MTEILQVVGKGAIAGQLLENMQELNVGTFSPFPNSMTLEIIKNCLYILNALLVVVIAIAPAAFCRNAPRRDKVLALCIGLFAGLLFTLVTEAAQNPQINLNTYVILVVGFCFCLGSIALFWKTWDTEAPQDDRTILLGFVRKEVSNRLQAMGVLSKYIPGRVEQKVESQDDHNSSSVPSSGIFKGIVSKVKVLFGGQEQDVLPGMAIADIFNQDTAKELLILGAPGGGKTTALLTLAMQLCEEAEQNIGKPIPIVLELSSWQPAEEIPHWIALQLKAKYQLSEATCQEYLKGGRFVLLLDGLDELKDDKDACIEAINQFRTNRDYEFQQVVVCSRLIDYKEATKKLQIARAYCLLELNDAEIKTYLTDPNPPTLVSPLWSKLKADPKGFLQLARQPLLLDLIRKTYTDGLLPFPVMTTNSDPEQYQKDCQERLLTDYVEHQLEENHDHRGYNPRKTKHYLKWLAQNLKRKTTTEFLLENMQPSWLEPQQRIWYQIAIGLILGLIGGLIALIVGVISALHSGLYAALMSGLIFGLMIGLMTGLIGGLIVSQSDIEPYEILKLNSYSINTEKLIMGLSSSLIFGLICGLVTWLAFGEAFGLISSLVFFLIYEILFRLKGNLRLRNKPNQGIWNSGGNVIYLTGLFFPLTIVLNILFDISLYGFLSISSLMISLLPAIAMSLFIGIYGGGGVPFIEHFVLRYFFLKAGYIPRDYVGFLHYAQERGLILNTGGSFRFYHDILREYLATRSVQLPSQSPKKSSNIQMKRRIYLLGLFLSWVISNKILNNIVIYGAIQSALTPAINYQDGVLLDLFIIHNRSLDRSNIVHFNTSKNQVEQGFEKGAYLRRIVGLPQETIEIKEGKVYINNQLLTAPYAQVPPACTYPPTLIPADHYFVMGNNPAFPDCNTYAALVPKANITGQALWRLLPPSRFGQIE